MKRTKLLTWLTSALCLLPFCGMAQTYDQLWKEVEKYAEKDLPSSIIATADKIYAKGQTERNIPQMMKAYIVRAEYRGNLVPDSLDSDKAALKQWAKTETDPVGRSVLNSIVGNMSLEQKESGVSEAVRYFRESIADRDLLAKTSAKAYRPMTVSGTLSEKYFGDNMFDLLVRQAIRSLSNHARYNSMVEYETAFGFYDDLIAYYESSGNRIATFLCKESKLVFRYENLNRFTKYEQTANEMAEQLISLAAEYKGLSVCADAYLKAALYYLNDNEKVKAVDVAQRALNEYPKSEWNADLKKIEKQVTQAQIQLSIPFIYPEYDTELEVLFSNVKKLTIELYRLNISPCSTELSEGKWDNLLKKYGKKVSARHYDLEPASDYQQCRASLHYTLPQAGIYVMKQISNGIKQNILVDYSLLYVSPYQCIAVPTAEHKSEVIAVDRLSGRPVPGAELVEYEAASNKQLKVYKTNENGSVSLSRGRKNSLFNVRTPGNDFMALSFLGGTFYASGLNNIEEWSKNATLFTDRSIYRPGQIVHVSGLLFEQRGDSVRVRTDRPVELKLYQGAQTLGNLKLTSDEFGTFAGDFTLPQSLLPGRYFISGQQGSTSIEVEEYKRPTFDVKFIPYTYSYAMGDTVCLHGEVRTFAGAPVRNVKVKYHFSRACKWWYRWDTRDNVSLEQGEIQTDSDGKFAVNVILKAPDNVDWGSKWSPCFYDYRLSADVTDESGETQTNEVSLPVSNRSLLLSVQSLDDIVMREKQPSIQFQALNLNHQPVSTTIEYRVYAYEKGKAEDRGELKYTGKAEAQHSFVPADVWALPSGKYIIELSALDDKGRKCTTEKTFTLFSKEDRKVPDESVAWFYQDGDKFDEKNPPTFYVGTNASDVYLLIDVYNGKQRIDSKRMDMSNELLAFHYPYRQEYGDGILVKIAFMRKGVLYSRGVRIVRPEPQKELSLKWETFRDKLRPGDKEVWKLHLSDHTGHAVQANLMATLYDASLDKLNSHNWNFGLSFPRPYPSANVTMITNAQKVYMSSADTYIAIGNGLNLTQYPASYSLWNGTKEDYTSLFGFGNSVGGRLRRYYKSNTNLMMARTSAFSAHGNNMNIEAVEVAAAPMFKEQSGDAGMAQKEAALGAEDEVNEEFVSARENFAETAFFYPQLRSDSLGNVTIAFTVPESLTEWKFLGFAHTPYLDYGVMTDKVVTQKQFMIQPNMPRFVRRGDKATIAASLVNMATQGVKGVARIELSDPVTGSIVYKSSQPFSVAEGENGMVRFGFEVPQKYDVLICKITASAGEYSDGEQHYLPILTDKEWVTETIALQINGDERKTIKTTHLFNEQSKTATERRLTLEMTANPDWYAVQALPVAGNPQTEDALSWATAYYANALASVIVDSNPHIKQVFNTWMSTGENKETLLSNLERNQDLKNLLLTETPWLAEATDEAEQKRRIALLFDLNAMHSRLNSAVEKLGSLQNSDGSWSWYKGMIGNRYVTTQIVEEFARLKTMGVKLDGRIANSYGNAVKYLVLCAKKDYEEMRRMEKENKVSFDKVLLSEQLIHFLYVCALDSDALKYSDKTINDYFLAKLENRSADYTIYGKALVAIVMHGAKRTSQAADLVRSIKEYSVCTAEMGRYFDTKKAYYSWRNYKIPTEVAAMEAIYRISPDEKMLNEMKQWLLKQKQVQMWESSVATADAVYAFLSMNGNKLNTTGKMKAVIGNVTCNTPDDALGYTRKTLTGNDTKVGNVQIEKTGAGIGWGAVYAQYQEKIGRLSEYRGQGVSVTRDYIRDGKPIESGCALHVGDKLTVRLTIKADRDMDFIQIKDGRAACMEPVEQLSGYSWNGNIGFYRASYDASTCFFIDRMPKGTHQIEYDVYVDRVGSYQANMVTVQSAYSPEFGGHSGGFIFQVEE